jgi:hypothetical protein
VSVARFDVLGLLDMASSYVHGKVEIDRASNIFTVRRSRSRKRYSLPLSTVADMVVRRIVLAELAEKRRAKAARRKAAK